MKYDNDETKGMMYFYAVMVLLFICYLATSVGSVG